MAFRDDAAETQERKAAHIESRDTSPTGIRVYHHDTVYGRVPLQDMAVMPANSSYRDSVFYTRHQVQNVILPEQRERKKLGVASFHVFPESIGNGTFAEVRKGMQKVSRKTLAVKILPKIKAGPRIDTEINILEKLGKLRNSNNLVHLLDYAEDEDHVYLALEYCHSDLSVYLYNVKKKNHKMTDIGVQWVLRNLAEGLKALNCFAAEIGGTVAHRDLKPQNLLIFSTNGEALLKICDFGEAELLGEGDIIRTIGGTFPFMAPEVLTGEGYNSTADLWSVGVIVYQCKEGCLPFERIALQPDAARTVRVRVHIGDWELVKVEAFWRAAVEVKFAPSFPASFSPLLEDLETRLMKCRVDERILFQDFYKHPFFYKSVGPWPPMSDFTEPKSDLTGGSTTARNCRIVEQIHGTEYGEPIPNLDITETGGVVQAGRWMKPVPQDHKQGSALKTKKDGRKQTDTYIVSKSDRHLTFYLSGTDDYPISSSQQRCKTAT